MIDSDTHFLHIYETYKKDHKNQHTNENDFQQNNKNNTIFLTHQKFTHTPTNQIFTIIHNPDQHNKSSGNIIIISHTLYKSIGPVHMIPGRLIHVTFFFKQHHQLNIINLYLPPITSAKKNHLILDKIDSYISKQLANNNKYNYYIIMGDFNINLHSRKLTFNNHQNDNNNPEMDIDNNNPDKPYIYYHKKILNTLKNKHFKDLIKIYINPPLPTYFDSQNHTSYIDIIFSSPNLIPNTTFGNIIDAPINTDHKLIYITINKKFFTNNNNFINNSNNIIELNKKKYLSSTEKINYKKITTDQWTDFHNFILEEYKHNKLNIDQYRDIQSFINAFYENYTQSINRTIKSLNFSIIKNNSHQYEYTHDIRVIQNDIYYILKLIKLSKLYFSVNNNSKHLPLLNFWQNPKKLDRLKRISSDPTIKSAIPQDDHTIIWPSNLQHDNFLLILERLTTIYEVLKKSYDDVISHFNKKKIEKYINQRDNNIITNQRRMLNSILDQKPNIIKINRLIYKDDNNIKSFTTDPEIIESIAIEHYKNISKITRTDKSYDPDVTL
ncbi:hypothetical protein RhiirC2_769563 [Rhizophagus irregularis]|uniref:DNase I-like protein n=1 Tax=Rhizophagus irregularis TaxID=588596 RepID=A0A2N1NYX0_9GLOM|nr:hypothetical protein RhiirC2_769563 [Rhizophagus irregularis]